MRTIIAAVLAAWMAVPAGAAVLSLRFEGSATYFANGERPDRDSLLDYFGGQQVVSYSDTIEIALTDLANINFDAYAWNYGEFGNQDAQKIIYDVGWWPGGSFDWASLKFTTDASGTVGPIVGVFSSQEIDFFLYPDIFRLTSDYTASYYEGSGSWSASVVPIPAALPLMLTGLAGLLGFRRAGYRRREAAPPDRRPGYL